MTKSGALAGMIVGAATVIGWTQIPNLKASFYNLYEIIPGFLFSLIAIVIVSLLSAKPSAEIESEFDRAANIE
ncbi:Sodium/proline symporter [bioreactor metagenome]|uniref:Sodium/proline symporter n=2 Tax=root TaxID=1 RepID=A0A645HVC6_9ZZZZ